MRVLGVELRNFRTYARAEARLGEGLTVVHGPNGSGKSNLLEALYFGCTGHALRARNERELIRFGESAARVSVRLRDEDQEHELSVGYGTYPDSERPIKRMRVDGAPVERLLDVAARPLVSVFQPDRLELLKGPPAVRRAHLDQLVTAIWPLRAATRRAYSRALAQRNALIASIRAGRGSRETLPSWDRELAVHALALRDDRARAIELIAETFAGRARQLGLEGDAAVEYRPRSRAESAEDFLAELQERLPGDLERGFSTHGPHRDELLLKRDGRELRVYGSQGEQRRNTPLMLLDDVMSELDATRRELLAGELSSGGQSVIATTDLAHVPGAPAAHVTRLRVCAGAVLGEAQAA